MLVHNVYFRLKDRSEAACEGLLAACRRYLTGHPGVVFFACGSLAEDLAREVNDRDFDVALHLVFASRADHDAYQVEPRHKQFIMESRDNWEKVRIFDSIVESVGTDQPS